MIIRFLRLVAVVFAIGAVGMAGVALAMEWELRQPSIAVPADGEKPDVVVDRLQKILMGHSKEFIGGRALNARSLLHFRGGARTINVLLDELSKVEGATLFIRLSRSPDVLSMAIGKDGPGSCSVEHNGWSNPREITLTIHLDDKGLDPGALSLPRIQGR